MTRAALILAALGLGACDPRAFDDLAAETWTCTFNRDGTITDGDVGRILAGAVPDADGPRLFIAAPSQGVVLAHIKLDGALNYQVGRDAPAPMQSGEGLLAAATIGETAYLAVGTRLLSLPLAAVGDPSADGAELYVLPGGGELFRALGVADVDGDGAADLVALADHSLTLLPGASAAAPVVCAIPDAQARSLAVAPGAVFVGLTAAPDGFTVDRLGAAELAACAAASYAPVAAFAVPFSAEAITVGELDGSAGLDVAVGNGNIPGAAVRFDDGTLTQLALPTGAVRFGVTLLAGDLDSSRPGDELAVSDPDAFVRSDGSGRVHIVGVDRASDATTWYRHLLYDFEYDANLQFGRALALVDYPGSRPILAVGGASQVFLFYRTTPSDGDRRD